MDVQKLSLGQFSSGGVSASGVGGRSYSVAADSASSSWYKLIQKVFHRSGNEARTTATVFNPVLITEQLLDSDGFGESGKAKSSSSNGGEGDSRFAASTVSRRICGDWSPKLKLLRYVTKMPSLLFHFASDYSHQSAGYKAKVYIESGEYS